MNKNKTLTIKVEDVRLISEDEYIKLYGKPDWTGVDYDDDVYLFLDKHNYIVGDCVLFDNFCSTKVDNFVIRHHEKGYGRACVGLLKNKYGSLVGESVIEAIGFWSKMGAIFNPSDFAKIPDDEDELYDYNELTRFKIN